MCSVLYCSWQIVTCLSDEEANMPPDTAALKSGMWIHVLKEIVTGMG